MVSRDAILMGIKLFTLKGLKGRPQVGTEAELSEMLDVWADDLADIDEQVFIATCRSLSGELVWFPALAEIRQRCLLMATEKRATGHEIWPKIKERMLASAYIYADKKDREKALNSIECPVAREAAALFDWRAYARSQMSDESHHRHAFNTIYESVLERTAIRDETKRQGIPAPMPSPMTAILDGMRHRLTGGDA